MKRDLSQKFAPVSRFRDPGLFFCDKIKSTTLACSYSDLFNYYNYNVALFHNFLTMITTMSLPGLMIYIPNNPNRDSDCGLIDLTSPKREAGSFGPASFNSCHYTYVSQPFKYLIILLYSYHICKHYCLYLYMTPKFFIPLM